ncbi:hypothetical protein QTJ16_003391 [Diplocarpon rosae]|uniref:Uncharacterized protein n=1 Tax=Diplocarpon rosae TaxID=946125 RepID=A0AAD9T344_9HELO|nr:hypothetical protein QTJ16_003391 [Diplocarpon rosae]
MHSIVGLTVALLATITCAAPTVRFENESNGALVDASIPLNEPATKLSNFLRGSSLSQNGLILANSFSLVRDYAGAECDLTWFIDGKTRVYTLTGVIEYLGFSRHYYPVIVNDATIACRSKK